MPIVDKRQNRINIFKQNNNNTPSSYKDYAKAHSLEDQWRMRYGMKPEYNEPNPDWASDTAIDALFSTKNSNDLGKGFSNSIYSKSRETRQNIREALDMGLNTIDAAVGAGTLLFPESWYLFGANGLSDITQAYLNSVHGVPTKWDAAMLASDVVGALGKANVFTRMPNTQIGRFNIPTGTIVDKGADITGGMATSFDILKDIKDNMNILKRRAIRLGAKSK